MVHPNTVFNFLIDRGVTQLAKYRNKVCQYLKPVKNYCQLITVVVNIQVVIIRLKVEQAVEHIREGETIIQKSFIQL